MSKLRIAPRATPPQPDPAPLLTLDQLEILSSTEPAGEPRPLFTAEGLAQLFSYGQETSVDGLDTELRLAGLADLLRAAAGGDHAPGRDAMYFIAETLMDLRARMESSRQVDRYRVRIATEAK